MKVYITYTSDFMDRRARYENVTSLDDLLNIANKEEQEIIISTRQYIEDCGLSYKLEQFPDCDFFIEVYDGYRE